MVLEKVKEIISIQFNIDKEEINRETSFTEHLNADSLDLVELVMTLEDEFDLEVEDEDMASIKTVGDVVDNIENELDNK